MKGAILQVVANKGEARMAVPIREIAAVQTATKALAMVRMQVKAISRPVLIEQRMQALAPILISSPNL